MSKEKARAKRLKDCFNWTTEEWDIVSAFQNHVCYVCLKKQKSGKRLAVDHRHRDGLNRGLLCSQCNRLFGKIEGTGRSVLDLRRLIEYIENPPATRALGKETFGFAGRINTKRHRAHIRRQAKLHNNT